MKKSFVKYRVWFNIDCDFYILQIGKFLIIIGKSNKLFKLKKSNLFSYFLLVKNKEKIPTQQFFLFVIIFCDEIIKNGKDLPILKKSCNKFYTLEYFNPCQCILEQQRKKSGAVDFFHCEDSEEHFNGYTVAGWEFHLQKINYVFKSECI